MKSVFFLLIFAGIALIACHADTTANMKEGQITGPDGRKCACCGGWFLQTTDTTFLLVAVPQGSNIDLQNASFPLPVKFNYVPDTSFCNGLMNRITLTHIEVQ
ncbi:MAG: hypothetical protein IPL27_25210 [Lewinellaceae bacterium]|nr:hypothetical protein [Lewinellaceae bacterium]